MTTSSSVRQRRDAAALEARRKKAGRMFARDISQPEIARKLDVSRTAVYYWHTAWKKEGEEGLTGAGRFGRKSRLTEAFGVSTLGDLLFLFLLRVNTPQLCCGTKIF